MVSVTCLALRRPLAGLPQLELGLGHQRAGRAHRDAVAAVDAGRLGQRHVQLGRDVGVEAAPGDGDGEGDLRVGAAGLDALVAEHALRVVADVEVVVVLDRLRHGGGRGPEAGRVGAVLRQHRPQLVGGRQIHRRGQQLEHQLARQAHALGVGLHLHPGLGLARAGRRQHARALDLDDAHPAGVHRRQRLEVAERRHLGAGGAAGVEQRAALRHRHRAAVDRQRPRPRAPAPAAAPGSPTAAAAAGTRSGRARRSRRSLRERRAGAAPPTRSPTTPSGRGRRSTRRASPGRAR